MNRSKQTLLLISTTILLLSVTEAKSADRHSKDKALIRAAMNKMAIAFQNKDADGYVEFTDPDFVNVSLSGEETTHGKGERRAKVKKLFTQASTIKEHSTANSITFNQEGATVIQVSDSSYSDTVDGQNRVLKSHATYRDFWIKSSSGWLEKRSRTISSKKTLNGQPVR